MNLCFLRLYHEPFVNYNQDTNLISTAHNLFINEVVITYVLPCVILTLYPDNLNYNYSCTDTAICVTCTGDVERHKDACRDRTYYVCPSCFHLLRRRCLVSILCEFSSVGYVRQWVVFDRPYVYILEAVDMAFSLY